MRRGAKVKARVRKPAVAVRHPGKRLNRAEAALVTFAALLQSDHWLFEAIDVLMKARLGTEVGALEEIRLSIAKSIVRLQPLAYKAIKTLP